MKAYMFLNMRLAAPEAGTNFSMVPPSAWNCFHVLTARATSLSCRRMMPLPAVATLSIFITGKPVAKRLSCSSMDLFR